MAQLNLKKPIVFFDLETTGTDVSKDNIVEISLIKVFPDGHDEETTMRINPGRHIPEQATEVHHITDEDVKDCPTFKQVAAKIADILRGSDLAGFNSNRFDIPLLAEEFLRNGYNIDLTQTRFVDVQNIYHKLERRTLVAAYKYYCGKNLEEAHSANADTRATYEVLKAQIDKYPDDLSNDIDFLSTYSKMNNNVDLAGRMVYNEKGVEVFSFGKYKDQPVEEVLLRDPGYFGWILQSDFPLETKQALTRIRLKSRK
ncbi:MAG: 3'-5' exonuclease [Bacteroidaceae bacterium]|nr:3'-5' exonuclease [Candidatus Minthousia equi]MCQ2245829.1 3'-5' exonuclease [Bacteroidaceae bacterium]MDO4956865.1 3'-5' exonuclease [Bacteroidales bacterium]